MRIPKKINEHLQFKLLNYQLVLKRPQLIIPERPLDFSNALTMQKSISKLAGLLVTSL
jgi:hypothetical protein